MDETSKVTRFEVIDHTPCFGCKGEGIVDKNGKPAICFECEGASSAGRVLVKHNQNLKFSVSLQDEGRTLKVFINERNKV